jgi:hypothetical protein
VREIERRGEAAALVELDVHEVVTIDQSRQVVDGRSTAASATAAW